MAAASAGKAIIVVVDDAGANGRIGSDNPVPTPLPAPRAYGYDPAGRLASSSLPSAPTPLTQNWTYDNADRLTQIAHPGQASTTLGYDAADELTSAGGTTYG